MLSTSQLRGQRHVFTVRFFSWLHSRALCSLSWGFSLQSQTICKLRPRVSYKRLCFVFSGTHNFLFTTRFVQKLLFLLKLHSSLVLQATLALLSEVHFTAGFSCSVQCLSSPVLDRLNTPFAVFASVPSRVTAPGCVCFDALLPRNHHHNLHINAVHRRPLHRITHIRYRRPSNWEIWRGTPGSHESTGSLIEAVRAQADMQDVQRGLRTRLPHWPLQITNQVRPYVCVAWSGRITARESSGRWL
jgi:hypothetical protein